MATRKKTTKTKKATPARFKVVKGTGENKKFLTIAFQKEGNRKRRGSTLTAKQAESLLKLFKDNRTKGARKVRA